MDRAIFPSSGMARIYEFLENHIDATEGSCTDLLKKSHLWGKRIPTASSCGLDETVWGGMEVG